MRILFDQGTPLPLKRWLTHHDVETAHQRGWSKLLNGDLLAAADAASFDVFVTTDQRLHHEQDLSRYRVAVLVLMVANWPAIAPRASDIAAVIDQMRRGQLVKWSAAQ